jgi:hypothetical protein
LYEGLRVRQAAANLTTIGVPDALQRAGNFSRKIKTTVIYDPATPVVSGFRTRFLLLLALSAPLLAQNETASLTGRVVDPAGLGVPGAEIKLSRPADAPPGAGQRRSRAFCTT